MRDDVCQLSKPAERFRGVIFAGKKVVAGDKLGVEAAAELERMAMAAAREGIGVERPGDAEFAREVLRAGGLDPGHYRLAPLLRRIPACLRGLRVGSVAEARVLLESEPEKAVVALNALLIGTTAFFRDEAVFAELRGRVVPEMLERNAQPRVWSVAGSEGAELYSVAMLLGERQARGFLLGSDCRAAAVAVARAGRYHVEAVKGVPAELREKYLVLDGHEARVSAELQAQVYWEQSDILARAPVGRWEMILCRNLAIYLGSESAQRLWRRLIGALVPGGVMVVGKAEKPQHPGLRRISSCIYQLEES